MRLLVFYAISCFAWVFGQTIVTPENFPDPAFRDYVLREFGPLTLEAVGSITSLDTPSDRGEIPGGVSDLRGVQFFVNLERLIASYEDIKTIPSLAGLGRLEEIDLKGNSQLEGIPDFADSVRFLHLVGTSVSDLGMLKDKPILSRRGGSVLADDTHLNLEDCEVLSFLKARAIATGSNFSFAHQKSGTLVCDRFQSQVFPHLTKAGAGFLTQLFLDNTGEDPNELILHLLDENGDLLSEQIIVLAGHESLVLTPPLAARVAWVASPSKISAFVGYAHEKQPEVVAFEDPSLPGRAFQFMMGPSNPGFFQGLVLFNPTSLQAEVEVTSLDNSQTEVWLLEPGQKVLIILEDHFHVQVPTLFTVRTGELISYVPIAVMGLAGTTPGNPQTAIWPLAIVPVKD